MVFKWSSRKKVHQPSWISLCESLGKFKGVRSNECRICHLDVHKNLHIPDVATQLIKNTSKLCRRLSWSSLILYSATFSCLITLCAVTCSWLRSYKKISAFHYFFIDNIYHQVVSTLRATMWHIYQSDVYWTWLFSIEHNNNDELTNKWLGSALFGDRHDA